MKKRPFWLLTGLFSAILIPYLGFGQTALEVLDKMIEAQGGRKVLEKITETTVSGSMELIQQGGNATMTLYQKEPDKIRIDIEIMGMTITQAYDGKKAWMTNVQTGENEILPESLTREFQHQAIGNAALLYPEKYGITYALKGTEKTGDKEYLILEQTLSDGFKTIFCLDPATHLVSKTKATTLGQAGADIQAETLFSDYRKEGGILMAHSLTVLHDGAEFLRLTITNVDTNSGLQESLFQMEQ